MKRILIIDDNPEIRENTTELLELEGFSVISAQDGKEGLLYAREQFPDIILCDIMMPQVNGYEVIRQLKADEATARIPFIYVTASGEKNEVKLAMDMGAQGYVRKPFDVTELMTAINKCLRHTR